MGSLKPDSLLKLEARFKRFKEKQNNVEQERMIRLPKIETLENKCVKTPNKACPNVNTFTFVKNDVDERVDSQDSMNYKSSRNLGARLPRLQIEDAIIIPCRERRVPDKE